jgi:hypothetical protein
MNKIIIGITVLCGAIVIGVAMWPRQATVDNVLEDFHTAQGRAEDMLMDPLILNAELVKNRVIHDIKNPEMDKRRYAIGFLGNARIPEAIPVLVQILSDASEKTTSEAMRLRASFGLMKRKASNLWRSIRQEKTTSVRSPKVYSTAPTSLTREQRLMLSLVGMIKKRNSEQGAALDGYSAALHSHQ